ncbi:uncharacterized protein LOC122667276 [Telopea speciosissima]|uniref:uncharacterized protein LOC122667276 n=1 Tax=Telopea speciosissima TaxID=54955 RepID=UPI001CC3BD1F|nr:uncharacterized protein LOC122667276 [Telopea speciosissima]
MGSNVCLSELAVWMVVILHSLGSGLAGGRSITREQYLQMKAHRKSLINRPAIKSIKATNGDIFDCVDIYKQPALDHTRLKNHTIQMKPSTYLLEGIMKNNNETSPAFKVPKIGLKNGGCPLGTVPIRRVQIKDTQMMGFPPKFGKKDDDLPHHYAAMAMKETQASYGTSALVNIWKPKVQHNVQFTLAQIWVTAGPPGESNYVEVGWHVYPYLNDDYESRLFVLWTADDYKNYCYNFQCQGYVQVSKNLSPGMAFEDVSVYGGAQYANYLSIVKDMESGNWLLLWGLANELIGYWPKDLFNHLAEKADDLQWGGETYGPIPVPEMGSAHFPEEGYGKACFMAHIRIVDQFKALRGIDPTETHSKNDVPACYKSIVSLTPELGANLFFGGPGGNCVPQS